MRKGHGPRQATALPLWQIIHGSMEPAGWLKVSAANYQLTNERYGGKISCDSPINSRIGMSCTTAAACSQTHPFKSNFVWLPVKLLMWQTYTDDSPPDGQPPAAGHGMCMVAVLLFGNSAIAVLQMPGWQLLKTPPWETSEPC